MAAPISRATLIDYAKRRLGWPVIEINVDDDQAEDRLDDALQYFSEYHFDGVVKDFIKHQMTTVDRTNEYISISNDVLSVLGIFPTDDTTVNMFDVRYQTRLDWLNSGWMGNQMLHYDMVKKHMNLIQMLLSGQKPIRYNRHQNRLYLDLDWTTEFGSFSGTTVTALTVTAGGTGYTSAPTVSIAAPTSGTTATATATVSGGVVTGLTITEAGTNYVSKTPPAVTFSGGGGSGAAATATVGTEYIIIECWKKLDSATYTDIFDDMFLKEYVTALIKRQWGSNLSKYEGLQLPGGVTLNGAKIFEEAQVEIDKIQEQMSLKYELPTDFMIG